VSYKKERNSQFFIYFLIPHTNPIIHQSRINTIFQRILTVHRLCTHPIRKKIQHKNTGNPWTNPPSSNVANNDNTMITIPFPPKNPI
jgi:hypothetical protein